MSFTSNIPINNTIDAISAPPKASLSDVLDDLAARFILNLPTEEWKSFERILFQIEQAHWFYIDNCWENDPSLPKWSNLKEFARNFFQHCELLRPYLPKLEAILVNFRKYKLSVPVYGAIVISDDWQHVLMVRGMKGSAYSFPRGKMNKNEDAFKCAIREVYEETGFSIAPYARADQYLETSGAPQTIRLYLATDVSMDTAFQTLTRGEIAEIVWAPLSKLKTMKTWAVTPFIAPLLKWIKKNRKQAQAATTPASVAQTHSVQATSGTTSSSAGDTAQPSVETGESVAARKRARAARDGITYTPVQSSKKSVPKPRKTDATMPRSSSF